MGKLGNPDIFRKVFDKDLAMDELKCGEK